MANGNRRRSFGRRQGQLAGGTNGTLPPTVSGPTTPVAPTHDATTANGDANSAATLVPDENADSNPGVVVTTPVKSADDVGTHVETGREIPDHPLADIIPIMSDADLDAFTKDIKANGLGEDIVLYEGKILDGRARHQACIRAGVEPRYVEYAGSDPLGFVVSKNLHRRHLTDNQRTVAAAKAADLKLGANQHAEGMPIGTASRVFNVSPRSVARMKVVLRDGIAELVKAVQDGKMTVGRAEQISQLPTSQQGEAVTQPPKRRPPRKPPTPNGTASRDDLVRRVEAYKAEIKGFEQLIGRLKTELALARQHPTLPAGIVIEPTIAEVGDLGLPLFLERRELTDAEKLEADDLQHAWDKASPLVRDRFLAKQRRSLSPTPSAP